MNALLAPWERALLLCTEQELCKTHSKKHPGVGMCPIASRNSLVTVLAWGTLSPLPASPVCEVLPAPTAPFVPCSSCTLI